MCTSSTACALKGWIEFEYEGQGCVRLEAGSCVHQPPGIRHREPGHIDDVEMLETVMPSDFATEEVAVVNEWKTPLTTRRQGVADLVAVPDRDLPPFGGLCTVSLSKRFIGQSDPLAWRIVGGKGYLISAAEVVLRAWENRGTRKSAWWRDGSWCWLHAQ